MQSTGNLVIGGIEFSASVKRGEHYLCGRNLFAIHYHVVHGNAAAVIDNSDGVIDVNGYIDAIRMSGKRFVNGIVHDFVNQMM